MEMIRVVGVAEVMWAYLANEYKYKGTSVGLVAPLGLDQTVFPQGLRSGEANILALVEKEVGEGRCHQAVLLTLRIIYERRWSLRRATADEVGGVWSILPAELPARGEYEPGRRGPIRKLLPGWQEYLGLAHTQAQRAKEGHQQLVKLIQAQQLFTYPPIIRMQGVSIVADGRHRLFALVECGAANPRTSTLVYWEVG